MPQTMLAGPPKIKGVADIVFVVDFSGSMSDLIDGLKRHIGDFAAKLIGDPQATVRDLRLGLVTHDVGGSPAVHSAPFVASAEGFRQHLAGAPSGSTEFGLPAIDVALDFPWRPLCRRYIVFFTDEPVEGGHDPQRQQAKLQDLCQKTATLHVHFVGYGPSCPSYELVGKTPGSSYQVVDRGTLSSLDMKDLLSGIARTITLGRDQQESSGVQKNLYGL